MSEIKTIGELRNELKVCGCDPDECMSCSVPRKVKDGLDKVEREIAEHCMELPCDCEGVPIHVGDVVEFGENRNQGIVKALNEHMVIAIHVDDGYTNYAKYGLLWNADACRHFKSRTVEDVLMDVMSDFADADFNDETLETITARYADELREMLGGDAE